MTLPGVHSVGWCCRLVDRTCVVSPAAAAVNSTNCWRIVLVLWVAVCGWWWWWCVVKGTLVPGCAVHPAGSVELALRPFRVEGEFCAVHMCVLLQVRNALATAALVQREIGRDPRDSDAAPRLCCQCCG